MKADSWLRQAVKRLSDSGITTARLDALILLEDATGKDRAWLLAHNEHELASRTVTQLSEQIERRAKHEPLAYIRGRSEFYGREFKVTPATLQPRPETETMLDLLLGLINNKELRVGSIADIGTGSGCIAITAKLERPELKVFATEINEDALKIARDNAEALNADVEFYSGNLFEPIMKLQSSSLKDLAVLANLPYVPNSRTINQAAMQEPAVAIFGGEDGLDLYRELFEQLARVIHEAPGTKRVLTESLPFQHEALANAAKTYGFSLKASDDLIQLFESNV